MGTRRAAWVLCAVAVLGVAGCTGTIDRAGGDAGAADAGGNDGPADNADAGPNQPPLVDAGPDQFVYLPDREVTLTATAHDPEEGALAYEWHQNSGAGVTLAGELTASLEVADLNAGVYVFTITVTDPLGATGSDSVQVTVGSGIVDPAYYVSPTGSDLNDGMSALLPFQTLEKARDAARATTTKTVYLLGGVYARTATLVLSAADAGQSWLGFPGQTPILDGGGSTATAIVVQADQVTVRWLTLRDFALNGIFVGNWGTVTADVIDSNTILNTISDGWTQAAILVGGNVTDAQITHNLIDGTQYNGIGVHSAVGNDITGLTIAYNAVYHTCLSIADCGGIYAMDREHASTEISIYNNVVGDYGTTSNGSKGIYLDDWLSNVTVSNNVVYGTGEWAFQIHGGDHNIFTNNVFDISGAIRLGLYQDVGTPNYGMTDNSFSCNIVYSSAAPPSRLWDHYGTETVALPAVSANLYWGAGGALPNTSPIVDSSPTVADPSFVDPALADYGFAAANPAAYCGFQPIDASQVGPVPNL